MNRHYVFCLHGLYVIKRRESRILSKFAVSCGPEGPQDYSVSGPILQ